MTDIRTVLLQPGVAPGLLACDYAELGPTSVRLIY